MGVSSYDAITGKPNFNNTSNTQADLQANADYTAGVATRREGTTAERAAIGYLFPGLEWYDTNDGKIYVYVGPAGGWVLQSTTVPISYAPNLIGITVGNGTLVGSYTVAGHRCSVTLLLKFGSTTAITAGGSTWSLPLSASAIYAATSTVFHHLGTARHADVSAGATAYGSVVMQASDVTAVGIDRYIVAAANVGSGSITSTTPFTWATGDYISAFFNYELAV